MNFRFDLNRQPWWGNDICRHFQLPPKLLAFHATLSHFLFIYSRQLSGLLAWHPTQTSKPTQLLFFAPIFKSSCGDSKWEGGVITNCEHCPLSSVVAWLRGRSPALVFGCLFAVNTSGAPAICSTTTNLCCPSVNWTLPYYMLGPVLIYWPMTICSSSFDISGFKWPVPVILISD